MRATSPGRAMNASLDLFTAACVDMKLAANNIADAYLGMHAAIIELNLAWQRLAHSAHRGQLHRAKTRPASQGGAR